MQNKKSGTIVITGKPNVGKSTFINQIAKNKIAICSPKPQTTRDKICYIYHDNDSNIAFIDTPGFHIAKNKLDEYLNEQIKTSYKYASIFVLMIDLTREIDEEDLKVINLIKSIRNRKLILVLNKKDKVNNEIINKYIDQINKLIEIDKTLVISAKNNNDINEFLKVIKDYLQYDEILIDDNLSDDFIITETIREEIIFNCYKEIPYSTLVKIQDKSYDKIKNIFTIYANIIVEKNSQKPILVGKNGSMIKKIGTNVRKKLNNYFDCKIVLHLFVIVENDWRNNKKIFLNN